MDTYPLTGWPAFESLTLSLPGIPLLFHHDSVVSGYGRQSIRFDTGPAASGGAGTALAQLRVRNHDRKNYQTWQRRKTA